MDLTMKMTKIFKLAQLRPPLKAEPNLIDFVIKTHRDTYFYGQIMIFQTFPEIRVLFDDCSGLINTFP